MNDDYKELVDMLASVFSRNRGTNEERDEASVDYELWKRLASLGLDRLTGGESRNGSGGSWIESMYLLEAVGRDAARAPIAENDLLAGWLLDNAAIQADDDLIRTAAVTDARGFSRAVPWGRAVDRVVILYPRSDAWFVADVPVPLAEASLGVNYAGEPRDDMGFELSGLSGIQVDEGAVREFHFRGGLARAHLIVGAMSRIQQLVVEHTTVRVQFGRPLAKFQAVQQLVADLASEAEVARAGAEAAAHLVHERGFSDSHSRFAIAASLSMAGHATSTVVRNAHQAMGAIGFTAEHELHRHTNRLLSWRSDFGSVRSWDDYLTEVAISAGAAKLWPSIIGS
ncbi:acyl-CoA dehydrogenase family protein [Williamsia muralis]|uniref:Acyl-CoA dehydrogenase n=1 Tax=Williamsia marianensis TaxID=85044 RepID=A0A2G3PKA0_WILMA|nr:acyl-CoA dehydrogenase family protein [Williamsia marianensis]PHV66166.1 acyl-CoA dehydrogenase [Williamsia marianensis]